MLAIAGGKGGCGKTTTTLGLADALASRGRTVLAADADRDMPNLHTLAGVDRSPGLADLATDPPEAVAHATPHNPDVAVVPAAPTVQPADAPPLLARLRGVADRVLVDCPAGAGPAAVSPLRAADRVLLVTTLTPQCLRDTAKTAAMAHELGTDVVGVVVTRADATSDEGIHRAAELLSCPLLARVPSAAADTGRGVLVDDRVAASYARLARAIRWGNT